MEKYQKAKLVDNLSKIKKRASEAFWFLKSGSVLYNEDSFSNNYLLFGV